MRMLIFVTSALLTLSAGTAARAHAFLDHAEPRGNQMSVPLRAGGAGTYHVNWHVLSVDTHTTEGNFSFQVGQ
jgi:methionine-rich copper-binding protein CopC